MSSGLAMKNPMWDPYLLCGVGAKRCGIPLGCVVETMRPLPVESLPEAPGFLLGLAIIRGSPTPVVDAGALLGRAGSAVHRFVTLKAGDRRVALAVERVWGVESIARASRQALPPLFGKSSRTALSEIGTLDLELLFILESVRLVPEAWWNRLTSAEASR